MTRGIRAGFHNRIFWIEKDSTGWGEGGERGGEMRGDMGYGVWVGYWK